MIEFIRSKSLNEARLTRMQWVKSAAYKRKYMEDENLKLKVYHSTFIDNLDSIMSKGLVPGFQAPAGQDWKGKYSGKGIYVHSAVPKHELKVRPSDIQSEEDIAGVIMSLELKIPIDVGSEESTSKIIPEEENPDHKYVGDPRAGIYAYGEGGALVYLGKIKPQWISAIYLPNNKTVLNYVTKKYPKYKKLFKLV
ncbi:hypothetical protein LIS04_213 [Listeria phage LIS04]|nr:hypothetical protein LIS04_213 [Listeria phage LIS04]